jgi:3-hydroxyacyl-CoA dehydrogenase
MGAGIAATIARSGVPVLLLDLVEEAAARAAVAASEAQSLWSAPAAAPITAGSALTDLSRLAECDWIIEAIVERPNAKRDLLGRIDGVRKAGSIVSSTTATLRLATLTQGLGARLAADFLITHFFHPPATTPLLELVAGPASRPQVAETVCTFVTSRLGKNVFTVADAPGFLVNRLRALWFAAGLRRALDLGLSVEEADAVCGRLFGSPDGQVFAAIGAFGIERGEELASSLLAALPATDALVAIHGGEPALARMLAVRGEAKRPAAGFYAGAENATRGAQVLDLDSGVWREPQPVALESLRGAQANLRALAEYPDRGGRYARALLLDVLPYAATLVPAVADGVDTLDSAVRLGLGWSQGPFELIDRLGVPWLLTALETEGRPVPELLRRVGGGSFYRVQDGRPQAFTPAGGFRDLLSPAWGVLAGAALPPAAVGFGQRTAAAHHGDADD